MKKVWDFIKQNIFIPTGRNFFKICIVALLFWAIMTLGNISKEISKTARSQYLLVQRQDRLIQRMEEFDVAMKINAGQSVRIALALEKINNKTTDPSPASGMDALAIGRIESAMERMSLSMSRIAVSLNDIKDNTAQINSALGGDRIMGNITETIKSLRYR